MDCSRPLKSDYAEFSRKLHEKAAAAGVPIAFTIEVTSRCNISCEHCFIRSHNTVDAVSTDQWKQIIDQAADMGAFWICITGGEPLVRDDFIQIYEHAKRRGLLVTLFTNGVGLSDRIVDLLRELPPFLVELSLYAASQRTYEMITGSASAFGNVIKGIESLVEKGVRVDLKTMVVKGNRHEIWEMKYMAQSMGLGFRFDAMVHPALEGARWNKDLRLSPEDVLVLEMEDDEKRSAWLDTAKALLQRGSPRSGLFRCGVGVADFYVDSSGFLRTCALYRGLGYDLKRSGLKESWSKMTEDLKAKQRTRKTECSDCPLSVLCGICPAWSFLETGHEQGRPEYICKIGQLRAEALGCGNLSNGARNWPVTGAYS
jgi:radical SAM protein with 4Fe4S-binding SPASM domain